MNFTMDGPPDAQKGRDSVQIELKNLRKELEGLKEVVNELLDGNS